MKILILNSSPRKKGVTSTLLSEIESNIAPEHSIETVHIYSREMKACIGCLKCRPDKRCVLPTDDAHRLAKKVKESDLLIFGTPVYWGNIPGPLKIFFDRNVPLFEYTPAERIIKIPPPQLKGKKAILVISSASPYPFNLLPSQSGGTIRALKTVLKAGGVKIGPILNTPDCYSFPEKKEKYLRKARKIATSIKDR